jgi:multimeric flavodoxin WrbA
MKCVEKRNGRCAIDDHVNDYFEKMLEADAIILGSPTYFAGIVPELKALIDRTGFVALANNNAFSGKIGAAVVAVRRGGATHVFDTINHMFLISSMIVPGSVYWNMGVGGDKGDVRNDQEGMQNMAHLGQVIAWLGKAMASVSKESTFPTRMVDLH